MYPGLCTPELPNYIYSYTQLHGSADMQTVSLM